LEKRVLKLFNDSEKEKELKDLFITTKAALMNRENRSDCVARECIMLDQRQTLSPSRNTSQTLAEVARSGRIAMNRPGSPAAI
jgi:hypothetical protein